MARPAHLHIFGFPVRFELWFFLVVGFVALSANARPEYTVAWIGIITGSILVHELGHAFAYRHYGASPSISLHGFGGLTHGHGSEHLTPGQRIVVSAAGSVLTIVLLGAPAYALLRVLEPSGNVELFLEWLLWINIIWALINLAPVFPLDGGQILDDTLLLATKRSQRRTVNWISLSVAGAIAVFFWRQGATFAVIIFGFLAYVNAAQVGLFGGRQGPGTSVDEVLSSQDRRPPP